jgi:molybdenum cofactor biosynthesis enzyme
MCKAIDRGMVMSDIRVMEKPVGELEGGVVRTN